MNNRIGAPSGPHNALTPDIQQQQQQQLLLEQQQKHIYLQEQDIEKIQIIQARDMDIDELYACAYPPNQIQLVPAEGGGMKVQLIEDITAQLLPSSSSPSHIPVISQDHLYMTLPNAAVPFTTQVGGQPSTALVHQMSAQSPMTSPVVPSSNQADGQSYCVPLPSDVAQMTVQVPTNHSSLQGLLHYTHLFVKY